MKISLMRTCALALALCSMLVLVCSEGYQAGTRTILQAGANRVNNNASGLAPASGMPALVNVTARSSFVLTAANGTLTRTVSNVTNGAVLVLDKINQQVTWYSEAPIRQSGAMWASTLANETFFEGASLPSSSWLNAGNMAVSYIDANTSLHETTILAISSAPDIFNGGSSWHMNVTINSRSAGYTTVVIPVNQEAPTVHEPSFRRMTSVSVFFSGACYTYDRKSGEISDWFFCTHLGRNGATQYS